MDMEKLIKPSEYAKELGISRQAVYAKIKRGILKSKDIDGKLYIVVKDSVNSDVVKKTTENKKAQSQTTSMKNIARSSVDYEELLKAKDETIGVLKDTISDLKESNKEISTTLRGEIDLLKEAFYEMRSMYANQLEYHQNAPVESIEVLQEKEFVHDDEVIYKWVSVKRFCKEHGIKDKKIDKYKKLFKKMYKQDDSRVSMQDDKLRVDILQDFSDILDI
jgi:predicted transcriptional regulator